MFADGMWIFYLEALLVLAIGAFIVWWTMPKQKRPAQRAPGSQGENGDNAEKSQSTLTPVSPASQTLLASDATRAEPGTQASTAQASGKD